MQLHPSSVVGSVISILVRCLVVFSSFIQFISKKLESNLCWQLSILSSPTGSAVRELRVEGPDWERIFIICLLQDFLILFTHDRAKVQQMPVEKIILAHFGCRRLVSLICGIVALSDTGT